MANSLNGYLSRYLLGLGGALVLSAVSIGAHAGISGSKHDLTPTGTATNRISAVGGTSAQPEICIFCHTPHASNTNVAAPLWNKSVTSGFTSYSVTNSSTMDGTVVNGGVSLACLSCHDGSQAMDTLINAPGSGGLSAGARAYNGVDYTWNSNGNGLMAAGIANLGLDLTNDHPIQIPYCGGGMTVAAGSTNITACNDADFKSPVTNAANNIVYFDGNANSKRDKADIQLYGRSGVFYVECGSCHDPHSAGGTAPPTFLRISNAGSAVCLTCHNK